MIKAEGLCVQKGIAIGKILIFQKTKPRIVPDKVTDLEDQWNAFLDAKAEAVRELTQMSEKAEDKVSKEQAMIFSVHRMLLEDPDFEAAVREEIKQRHHNASYAVYRAGEDLASIFAGMKDNPYLNERAVDFRDVANRVIRILQHLDDEIKLPEEPVILFTDDLTPQEVIGLDPSRVLAFVTTNGSLNSHTAILTRSLGITALVDTKVRALPEYNGLLAVVDAVGGCFYIDPDKDLLSGMMREQKAFLASQKDLEQMIGVSTKTLSGKRIGLCANISSVVDAKRALRNDAEGIGLFRSEFLYLNRQNYPPEEEQFAAYKAVAQIMAPKKVIIRTLDIGADKQNAYFQTEKEENPALGSRAIRFCMKKPEVFKTQLRAIYRASAFGTIGILFPMIVSVSEVEWIFSVIEEVKAELKQKKIKTGSPKIGLMIETPAAALISDRLAEMVDFFSIGTNDLTQYTLAADRMNASLTSLQDPHHAAILKLIEMTVQNAHAKNIPVAICGEIAADSELTAYFIQIGVDELSVPASQILFLRKWIRSLE